MEQRIPISQLEWFFKAISDVHEQIMGDIYYLIDYYQELGPADTREIASAVEDNLEAMNLEYKPIPEIHIGVTYSGFIDPHFNINFFDLSSTGKYYYTGEYYGQ